MTESGNTPPKKDSRGGNIAFLLSVGLGMLVTAAGAFNRLPDRVEVPAPSPIQQPCGIACQARAKFEASIAVPASLYNAFAKNREKAAARDEFELCRHKSPVNCGGVALGAIWITGTAIVARATEASVLLASVLLALALKKRDK